MKRAYYLPVILILLIFLFYTGLPSLRRCPLPKRLEEEKNGWLRHWFIVALTLVYAVVAFLGLGNTASPQTLRGFNSESAELKLATPSPVSRVLFYTGIVQGSYTVEFSPDGELWLPAASFEQGHVELLKWEELKLTEAPAGEVAAIRITGYSGAELCEVAVFDAEGQQVLLLPASDSAAVLCDEQGLVPEDISYLNSSYFDEIYHARTAWEHLRLMYPYEISHPPLGKLILSLGIAVFGMTPFGWRFMGTFIGVLMLPVIYWFARRLFGGRTVPACCAALLATDFMHFAQTRIATIDTYAVFFILLMYGFMYGWLKNGNKKDLALSGVFFGLGAASKWTCLYAGAGLGVLWLADWVRSFVIVRREVHPLPRSKDFEQKKEGLLKNIGLVLVFFILLPTFIYYLLYLCWQGGANTDNGFLTVLFTLGPASKWICILTLFGLAVLWLTDRVYNLILAFREDKRKSLARLVCCVLQVLNVLLTCILIVLAGYFGRSVVKGTANLWILLLVCAGAVVLWLLSRAAHRLVVRYQLKDERSAPVMRRLWNSLLGNIGFCLIFFVLVPGLIYYLSYLPYGLARGTFPFTPSYTRIVWDNQIFMFTYHSGVHATHPYSSRWYQWVLDIRPILFYLKYFDDGTRSSFGAWLNPVLCWGGLLALFLLLYMAIFRRDRKAAFLLVGYAAQLLPWVFITRTTFAYHYFPSAVFLVLALGYVIALMRDGTKYWKAFAFSLCGVSALLFVFYYPALTGIRIDNTKASEVMKWLPTWPF